MLSIRFITQAEIVQWSAMVFSSLASQSSAASSLTEYDTATLLVGALCLHYENGDVAEEVLHALGNLCLTSVDSRKTLLSASTGTTRLVSLFVWLLLGL